MSLGAFSSGIAIPEGSGRMLSQTEVAAVQNLLASIDPSNSIYQQLLGMLQYPTLRVRTITNADFDASHFYYVSTNDQVILVDGSAFNATKTVVLPDATVSRGREITVKRVDINGTTHHLRVAPSSVQTAEEGVYAVPFTNSAVIVPPIEHSTYVISGSSNSVLHSNCLTVISDGDEWYYKDSALNFSIPEMTIMGRTEAGVGPAHQVKVVGNNGLLLTHDTNNGGLLSIDRALQADMETPTAGNKIVASTVVVFHPGVVKAHARHNVSTNALSPVWNVSGLVDNGTGDWTYSLSGSSLSGKPNVLLSVEHTAPLIAVVDSWVSSPPPNTSIKVKCYDLSGTLTDPGFVHIAVLGDAS